MSEVKYIHDEMAHNLQDPGIIVPLLVDVLKPQSVVDLGCGIGTFLHVFAENGVKKILGLDGDWVDRDLLKKYINLNDFKVINLEKGFETDEKFDLAVCLEVLEHVDGAYADNAVKCLTQLSDIIVFSAAIPGQGGQNHVNEQWPEYWIDIFKKYGFTFHDVFRPVFWDIKELSRWYKQNMFLVVKNGHENLIRGFDKYSKTGIKAQVHPEYFEMRIKELGDLGSRYEKVLTYFDLINMEKPKISVYLKFIIKCILKDLSFYKNNYRKG